jgi:hypothetical protein
MAKKSITKPAKQPGEAELAETLGAAKKHWDALHAHIGASTPKARTEWKFYKSAGASGGWRCVVSDGRRNLLYLRPDAGSFLVSCALSDAQVDAAERAGVQSGLIAEIRGGPKLPEGRAARVEVHSPASLKLVLKLLEAKLSH